MTKGSIEDRQAFRVDDFVEIHFREASEDELEHESIPPEFSKPGENQLEAILGQLSGQKKPFLESIASRDPELAEVLSIIENQMRILASEISNKADTINHEPQIVNLSEVGIAFPSDEKIAENTLLRVRLILRPSYYDVNAYVRVVKVMDAKTANVAECHKPYWIATKIVRIPGPEQQKLTKHILYAQTKQRNQGLEKLG